MISRALAQETQRLLAEGTMSQRKIAKRVGLSRSTVASIASGQWMAKQQRRVTKTEPFVQPSGPIRRCPGCGGRVYMPCHLCRVRTYMARSQRKDENPVKRAIR